MEPRCDYLSIPVAVDYKRDKVYEGIPWCDLADHPCWMEKPGDCEEYDDFVKELEEEG